MLLGDAGQQNGKHKHMQEKAILNLHIQWQALSSLWLLLKKLLEL